MIVTASVILRSLVGFWGAETLAHESLLNPKASASLFGTPARSLVSAHRLDKGEKESLLSGILFADKNTRIFSARVGSSFPFLPGEVFPTSPGLVLRI